MKQLICNKRLQSSCYRVLDKQSISDTNDVSLVFVNIWDCRTYVSMTSMTSSVERTDLDFKISVALIGM